MSSLFDFGWGEPFKSAFTSYAAAGLEPARVTCELRRNFYAVQRASGEVLGECGGGFFHEAKTADRFPAIGDWVVVEPRSGESRADIRAVLPRRTKFSRRAAGTEEIEQIVAANVDTVFLVSGLDHNFNPQRVQRFLVAARESGAEPVILLNKSDLADDAEDALEQMKALAVGVSVFLTSTVTRKGLKGLTSTYAKRGATLAFIGSSGTGKSSLVNALLRDEALPVGEVREKDSKGRHTTTRRELVLTPSGALVIDTPGLRELQFWGAGDGIEETFSDIAALALRCRFGNCSHEAEQGCAVQAAMVGGKLAPERFAAYRKLKVEADLRSEKFKKASAIASKPGWRQRSDHQKPFRHRLHREDE